MHSALNFRPRPTGVRSYASNRGSLQKMNRNWKYTAACAVLVAASLTANAAPIADSGLTTDDAVAAMPAGDNGFVILTDVPCTDQRLKDEVGQPSYVAVSKEWLNTKRTVKGCYVFKPPEAGSDPNGSIIVQWATGDFDNTIKDSNLDWSPYGKRLALADRMRLSLILQPTGSTAPAQGPKVK